MLVWAWIAISAITPVKAFENTTERYQVEGTGTAEQAAPAEQTSAKAESGKTEPLEVDDSYVIGLGDVLYISVWKDPELTNSVVVLPDGMITFPLIGEVPANGKTVAELKEDLVKKIDLYVPDPVLTVSVQGINSMQFFIIGKVNRPGSYPLNTNLNVLQALSLAGGLNPFASRTRIKVLRDEGEEQKVYQFNYKEVVKGKNLEQNIKLERGDIIVVP